MSNDIILNTPEYFLGYIEVSEPLFLLFGPFLCFFGHFSGFVGEFLESKTSKIIFIIFWGQLGDYR